MLRRKKKTTLAAPCWSIYNSFLNVRDTDTDNTEKFTSKEKKKGKILHLIVVDILFLGGFFYPCQPIFFLLLFNYFHEVVVAEEPLETMMCT